MQFIYLLGQLPSFLAVFLLVGLVELDLMEYRGIRYTIRAGIERGHWFVVIHPQGVEVGGNKVVHGKRKSADPRMLSGHVQSIAYGIEDQNRSTSSELLASVNPTFSWVRLAQRIPVRIKLDDVPPDLLLVAGRTATVSIGQIRLW